MTGVETVMAAEALRDWPHVFSPLDMSEVREQLVESLQAEKANYQAARVRHDHAAADVAAAEAADLVALLAALSDGLDAARRRWMESDPPKPWPLAAI